MEAGEWNREDYGALHDLYRKHGLAGILQQLYRMSVATQEVNRRVGVNPTLVEKAVHDESRLRQVGGVSNVDIDGNNALQIKGYRSRHLHVCSTTRGIYAEA